MTKFKKLTIVFLTACFLFTNFNQALAAPAITSDWQAFKMKVKMYVSKLKEVLEIAKIVMSTYQMIKSLGEMFSGGQLLGGVEQLLSVADSALGTADQVVSNITEIDSRVGNGIKAFNEAAKKGDVAKAASELHNALRPPENASEEELSKHYEASREYCASLIAEAKAINTACSALINPKAEAEEFKAKQAAVTDLAGSKALANTMSASMNTKIAACADASQYAVDRADSCVKLLRMYASTGAMTKKQ